MRVYKEVVKKVVDEIFCDCCEQSCSKKAPAETLEYWHEYATVEATWGYFSQQDGTQYSIELCEHCFNEVLESMKKIRKRILGTPAYPHKVDPLNGKSYLS